MIEKTKYGRPRCIGRKLSGLQCREPKDTPSDYCHYCDQLVRGLTTPGHPGYDPRKGRINGYDWTAVSLGRKKELLNFKKEVCKNEHAIKTISD